MIKYTGKRVISLKFHKGVLYKAKLGGVSCESEDNISMHWVQAKKL